jgi:hypothetical protein
LPPGCRRRVLGGPKFCAHASPPARRSAAARTASRSSNGKPRSPTI